MSATVPEVREVGAQELELFTRQLGALLSTGVEVLRALDVASHHSGNQRLITVGTGLAEALADGREFHRALARYPDVFSPFYVQMARQGERDSVLGPALLAVADYLSRETTSSTTASAPGVGAVTGSQIPWGHLLGTALFAFAGSLAGIGLALWAVMVVEILSIHWFGPAVAIWSATCFGIAAAVLLRKDSVARICWVCGRGEREVAHLIRGKGMAICEACLRSGISQLKTPSLRQNQAEALAVVARTTQATQDDELPAPEAAPLAEGAEAAAPRRRTTRKKPDPNGAAPPEPEEPEAEWEPRRIEL